MNLPLPVARRKWPSRLANIAVVLIVLALAAATFVLTYSGIRTLAVAGGVSTRLARFYPGLFDAVLVIAGLAAVTLRARWWARLYAWLVLLVVLALVGTADALHAMNYTLRPRALQGAAAATPLVLALLGFTLLAVMLRATFAKTAAPAADNSAPALPSAPPLPALPASGSTEAPESDGVYELAESPADDEVPVLEGRVTLDASGADSDAERDYWEPEDDPELAGQTYAADEDELDANPASYATDPFASIPGLNRVHSAPVPPVDEE